MNAIDIQGLCKSYGNQQVLRSVDIAIGERKLDPSVSALMFTTVLDSMIGASLTTSRQATASAPISTTKHQITAGICRPVILGERNHLA